MKSSPEERIFRYELLEDARRLYKDYGLLSELKGLSSCGRFAPMGFFGLDLLDGVAVTTGVNHCNSRSSCPVCAYPRQLQMLDDISHAIWMARHRGHGVYLFTYTFSHHDTDEFMEIQRVYSEARQIMYRNGSFRLLCKSLGYVGRITDYEVQICGKNGFHPHSHELIFMDDLLNINDYKDDYAGYFIDSLEKVGLSASEERAFEFFGYKGVGDYVTKMGAEITLGNFTKESWGGGSMSPLQCLAMYHKTKNEFYAVNWLEFVEKIKHKRILGWSRGLKDYLGIKDFDDGIAKGESMPFMRFKIDDFRKLALHEWRQIVEWVNQEKLDLAIEKLNRVKISYYIDDDSLKFYRDRQSLIQ